MSNIRHVIESDTEEISGYTGLLGAILYQAVKELQSNYGKLLKERNIENYREYKKSRLFFEKDCNGYCEEELSKYILEKALKLEEEKHSTKDVTTTKNYINLKENKLVSN